MHAVMHDATAISMHAVMHDATTIRHDNRFTLPDDENKFHGLVHAILHDAASVLHRGLIIANNDDAATTILHGATTVLHATNDDAGCDVTTVPLWRYVPDDAIATDANDATTAFHV
jgi:hypothetical protein